VSLSEFGSYKPNIGYIKNCFSKISIGLKFGTLEINAFRKYCSSKSYRMKYGVAEICILEFGINKTGSFMKSGTLKEYRAPKPTLVKIDLHFVFFLQVNIWYAISYTV
jgi:hypothetical protein